MASFDNAYRANRMPGKLRGLQPLNIYSREHLSTITQEQMKTCRFLNWMSTNLARTQLGVNERIGVTDRPLLTAFNKHTLDMHIRLLKEHPALDVHFCSFMGSHGLEHTEF